MKENISGEIITFYSYKGGTGRTMALSNVACLLAKSQVSGEKVLMIDWDLEAPGLHRFFRDKYNDQVNNTGGAQGLIDLFLEIFDIIQNSFDVNDANLSSIFDIINIDKYIIKTDIPSLFLLKAGLFDKNYSQRVSEFNWFKLYEMEPLLFNYFAEYLKRYYKFTLIDSRTGLSDISGITTMLMPDKLVVVFTPNRQSLRGVIDLTREALNYRKQSNDLRPIVVFPLPSRIEASEPDLRKKWRYGYSERDIQGYQPEFENIFEEIYEIDDCNLEDYFNDIQIQHVPYYSYGEEIAVLDEPTKDRFSLTKSYENFTKIITNLNAPWSYKIRHLLFNVPDLPPNFLPRFPDLKVIKNAVLSEDEKARGITGLRPKVGILGMGGIGKSVLATAFSRDKEVIGAFPDGIIWINLGLDPNLTLRQSDLTEALSDERRTFVDVQQGRSILSKLLADKSCLIILDDVWRTEHVQAFDALGPDCRMIITTRNADIVTALGAIEIHLDILEDNEALKLLADWAAIDVEDLPAEALYVARECGNLPLALSMVGAMVRGKSDRLNHVLHRLRNADLEKIRQQFPDYPYSDLVKAFQVSVDALSPETLARYFDFAIFPEDALIPEAVLQTFWRPEGLDEYEVQDLLDLLVDRSLVRRDEYENLSLHNLLLDYVKKQAGDLAIRHDRLLDSYREKFNDLNLEWAEGPNDGYFFQHLARHLIEAGREDELRNLLLDFDWIRAKLEATDLPSLIADYDLLPENSDTGLVRDALRLSSHVIAVDKAQIASQMLGRLMALPSSMIQAMLDQIRQDGYKCWIRPITPSLAPPGGPLLRTLKGHSGSVSAASVTSNGRRAVSASWDQTLKVWDLETGEEIRTLKGHSEWVNAVAMTPDGRIAVSASRDKTLKVWDLESGEEIRTLKGHSGSVNAVSVTPDGRRAVSASRDQTLKVWDLERGEEIWTLKGHSSSVNAVAVTPEGRRAVSASHDKTLRLWDLERGEEIRTLKGHSGSVNAVAVTPEGRRAVSASSDSTLKVWDLERGEEIRTLKGHSGSVNAASVTPDGRRAVSASRDRILKVWDLERGEETRTLKGHSGSVNAVAVTPDGRRAVSASRDRTIKLWDLVRGEEILTLKSHSGWVNAVEMIPNGRRAVSASWDQTLKVWDLVRGEEIRTLKGHSSSVNAVAVTSDGRRAVSASRDQTLKVWDLERGEEIRTLKGHSGSVNAVAVTPNGRKVVSASNDHTIKVWDLVRGKEIRTLKAHSGSVNAVAVTSDGRRAVSASRDQTLKVWDLERGEEIRTLKGHSSSVNAVAITPDGQRAVSASWDQTLKVWDLERGEETRTLKGHSNSVNAVAITPNGQRAVSASSDQTIKVWDLERGEVVATFTGDGSILCCAVGLDGVTIVAGESSGRVHFLRLENG
ncbi:KGGVGR-motif variant AAA ATPase [Candidatus Methanocrinis natronophilus]|uniref:WD40 repeat-containing protein SMU1 n=1 Tax=Candidatus Methanocrinis natronophilus TaxID=3033396 RepID=A0ABT5X6S8_9EURY|nr:NB-ARC domain-containing protein [Candidatus Methanocrinis natronophilus]MDF0590402.1 NB-ARC domain-containing protein [Candidatus Methanocrinis natronophilus]